VAKNSEDVLKHIDSKLYIFPFLLSFFFSWSIIILTFHMVKISLKYCMIGS
jgi:hypothetical protein